MFKYTKKIILTNLKSELDSITKNLINEKLPKGFLDFILYSISELFANVKEHSKAKTVSIEIQINQNCSVKISDNGIGFRRAYISKNIIPKDDFSAIEFALSGLSTKDLNERGFGLYSIRKFIKVLDGEMIIESGFATVLIRKNKIILQDNKQKIRGVAIKIKSSRKELDFYKIIR